jgi:hypothetical protein
MATQSAIADNVNAAIRGTVTDTSGALVQAADVTAKNTETGVEYTTKSNATGLFEFPQLPIGPYTVSVSKQGFKSFKSTGIPLSVNQVYDLPVKLPVGMASETVEVRANAVQVETTDIQQKTVINSAQVVDLPLNGRNFTQLEQLAPGVVSSSDRFGTFSVNGSQSQQSNYLVNGTDTNDIALNTPGLLPSPDAIQEFNLISSTINPEYGRNSGGIVNAVIKNGTNQYHGSGFDYYRDTFLNARNFFTVGDLQPVFHQNQFGGTIGGPIKKDNTFFFLSYQGTYNRVDNNTAGIAAPQLTTVFSQAQRNGFFPSIAGSTTVAPIALVDENGVNHPANTTTYGALFPTGHIPTADFNTISSGLLNQFVPLPNGTGNSFTFNPVNTGKVDQGIGRADHTFNASNTAWFLFAENRARNTQALPFTGATLPGFATFSNADTKEITVSYTHTFSSSALNELRLGYFRFNFDTVEPQKLLQPASFGFSGINLQNQAAAQLPVIAVGGLFTLGFSDNGPQPRKDQNYQFTDNFTKILGKHTMKFGFDVRRFQVDNPFFFLIDGHYDFNGNGPFSTGEPGADFLLGVPDDYAQGSGAVINARAYEYYGYGQDQWKVRNNLTLTYGAGYQVDTPFDNNQFGGKAFNCIIPGQQSGVFPVGPAVPGSVTGAPAGAPAGLNFPGDPGCTKSGTTIKYGHIAPRFGFAYSPQGGGRITNGAAGKTSIRGGFGIYFNRYEEETALQNLAAPPFGLQSGGVGDVGLAPSFANPFTDISGAGAIANKFPFTAPKPGSAVDFSLFEPLSINTSSRTLSTPYAMNFNLNVQREFPSNAVVSLGYVGSLGRHLYRAFETDPITLAGAAQCLANPACVANRNLQHALFPSHSLLGSNTTQCPAGGIGGACFGSVGTQFTDGTSNYNSFQVSLTKGMTHGLLLLTSYTWSHSIDNGSGFENSGFGTRGTNPFFPQLNIGDSAQDARQRIVISPIYQIPNFHKLDRILGGWRITGITTFQDGFPVNFSDTNFRSLTCDQQSFYGCPDNPNQLVGNVKTLDPRTTAANGNHYFFSNQGLFQRQTLGTFGNTGRNSIHGPGIINTDLALLKDTKISEGKNVEVGIQGFNVFNHSSFSNPTGRINSGSRVVPASVNPLAPFSNFGRITSTQIPDRIVQLLARFTF